MSGNGAQIGSRTIGAGVTETFIVQGHQLAAAILEVQDTDTVPVAAPLNVTVVPLMPDGSPYGATAAPDLEVASGAIAVAGSAVLLDLSNAPGTGYALDVQNTDAVAHDVVVNVLVKG